MRRTPSCPHFSLLIPGHLPQLQKQEKVAELPPPLSTHPWSPPPAAQAREGPRAAPPISTHPWLPPPAAQAGEGPRAAPPLSTHPWSPPPAAQAGKGRRAAPHFSLPILED